MKVSKVFGCVLGLHFCVIAILLVQPGCRTNQPPTQTYKQERTMNASGNSGSFTQQRAIQTSVPAASRNSTDLIEATRTDLSSSPGLDGAFNAGFDDGNYAPDGANDTVEFSEFEDIAPIAPLPSGSRAGSRGGSQTVAVAGSSLETYTVKKGDNLWSIAKRYNVSLNELYAANGLNKNSVIRIGQQIEIPVEGGTATVNTVRADTYQPTSYNQATTSYTVKGGDSLSRIAQQFNTSVRAIKAANGKTSDLIRIGEKLLIPVSGSSTSSGSSAGSASSNSSVAEPVRASTTTTYVAPSTTVTSGARTHTVQSGEFPATIARKYGMTSGELLALNGITDPRKLQVGKVLKVSGSGSAQNVDSRTETVVAPRAATTSFVNTTGPASTFVRASNNTNPVEITVIEADPLLEGEATEIQTDEMFDSAIEIPVIRLEE